MKKILTAVLICTLLSGAAWAEVVKGRLEKVDTKNDEAVVSGIKIKMASDVTITLENQARMGREISIDRLHSFRGKTVYCRGREDAKKGFIADFITIYTWK
jgi:hypothetical protein